LFAVLALDRYSLGVYVLFTMVRQAVSLPVLDGVFVPDEKKAGIRRRLKRARGQVDGIERMLEANRPCREILQQIAAAQEALRAASKIMVRNYVESCVTRGIKSGRSDIYDEVLDVIYRMVR
jgi:DNA-binding FrmR family transcriptional regulator